MDDYEMYGSKPRPNGNGTSAPDGERATQEKDGLTTAAKPNLDALYHRKPILPPSSGTVSVSTGEPEMQFAPPPKFSFPQAAQAPVQPPQIQGEFAAPAQLRTIYSKPPALRTEQDTPLPSGQRDPYYQVEAPAVPVAPPKKRNVPLIILSILLGLVILVLLGYLLREPLSALFQGEQTETAAVIPTAAYDPAPKAELSDSVLRKIDDIASGVPIEVYAATQRRIIARAEVGDALYDYYLFSAEGALLGYFENMRADQVLALENEITYVAEAPYLYDQNGRAILDMDNYRHLLDSEPVVGPVMNGWAIISDREQTKFNFVNTSGQLFNTLWYSKVYPFTCQSTLGYVDTGAQGGIGERYYLYQLSADGTSTMLQRCADMRGVEFAASQMVLWSGGDLCALNQPEVALGNVSEIRCYPDCRMVAARDRQTGKMGLFLDGKLMYDFLYDDIAPVASDLDWLTNTKGAVTLCTLGGEAYPAPLNCYFMLSLGDGGDVVGFAVASRYPCPMELDKTEADGQ